MSKEGNTKDHGWGRWASEIAVYLNGKTVAFLKWNLDLHIGSINRGCDSQTDIGMTECCSLTKLSTMSFP